MAENKKSFVLYCDLIHTIGQLPNEKAGELFKHILLYVNDHNPVTEDIIINIAFEPIKQQLKRDLKKWDNERKSRSDAGKKGMEKRWGENNKTITNDNTVINDITNITDNVTVTVNDNDNIDNKFNFKKSLLSLGFNKELVDDWLLVRKNKKATNTQTALNKFLEQVKVSGLDKDKVLSICVEKSWSGFNHEWIKDSHINSDYRSHYTDEERKTIRQYINGGFGLPKFVKQEHIQLIYDKGI